MAVAANGVDAVLPGEVSDAGSNDPSATTVGGATPQPRWPRCRSDAESPAGTSVGDAIDLPPIPYH